MLREVASGVETGATETALSGALRYGVQAGKIFCPVTAEVVVELTKQSPANMAGTMMVIDLLSLGVAMVPHQERTAIEFHTLMTDAWPSCPPVDRPIWTAFAFAFGYEDLKPSVDGLTVDDALICALADRAWQAPPSLLASSLEQGMFQARECSEDSARRLNAQHALHAHEIDGFETAWRIETRGACSLLEGIAQHEIERIAAAEGHDVDPNSHQTAQTLTQMVAAGLRDPANRRRFGSLYVPAVIHAAIRAANRTVKANDIYDFQHAAAALPYCRAFFTDGSLRTLICAGHTALDREYTCTVVSRPADALAVLKDLCS